MRLEPGRDTAVWFAVAGTDTGVADARAAFDRALRDCYTGEFGLFHTGTGPTGALAGNPGPSCDPLVSEVGSERAVFSLNTAVMAVAEGNFGRLAQQRRYTTGNARIQLDPAVWETPEIAPSPDFTANVDRPFTDRSMALQAWGAYGVLWPVVRQQFGVVTTSRGVEVRVAVTGSSARLDVRLAR